MRAALVALAVVVVAAPVADARPAGMKRCVAAAKKRQKRCAPQPHAPAPMTRAVLTAPIGDPLPLPDPPPAAPARLGVVAREWSLTLSRPSLPAGTAIVQLQNFGEDAHNLRIERVDGSGTAVNVPLAEAGAVQSSRAALTPGDYKLYCALPGHEAQGMRATLTIGG